jgi:hypothetical protein
VSETLDEATESAQLPDDEGAGELESEELIEEEELDPEVVARRKAALSHVRKWGDPVL